MGDSAAKKRAAFKVMGLEVKVLLGSCVKTPEGTITRQEHGMFWQQVDSKREATDFLVQVLELLKTVEKKSSGGVGPAALVNTIAFICLFLSIDPSNAQLKLWLKDWKKNRDALTKSYPPIKEVIRTLQLQSESADLIGPLVIACSTLHTLEEFQQLSNTLAFPAYEDSDINSGENCFVFQHLSKLCNDPVAKQAIMKHTLSKMMTLSQQMKQNPVVAHTTLLSLLLMLRHYLAKEPVDMTFIKRAISTVQPFYLWPRPYGTAARHLLELLQMELLAPGHTMRQQLYRESLSVEKGQTLFYIIDAESKKSLAFAQTMELKPYAEKRKSTKKEPKNPLPPITQALIIMGMMEKEPQVGLTPTDIEMFKKLTRDSVVPLYEKLETFTENVPKNFLQAKQARIEVLTSIKSELKKITSTPPPEGTALTFPEKLETFTPPPNEVEHDVITSTLNYNFETHQNLKLMCLKFMPYPGSDVYDKYFQILTTYSSRGRDKKLALRIILGGGDRLLHFFLCAHLRILQTEPQLLKGLDVRFYIVPMESNHVASYLARYDSWYNRHIYVPFRSKAFILPGVRVDQISALQESKDGDMTLPGQFYRESINHYLAESRFRWEINVYQCECWLADRKEVAETPGGTPGGDKAADDTAGLCDYNIPFIQNVELGLYAVAQDYLDSHQDLDPSLKPEDVAKEKDFKFDPPTVAVTFTKVDLNGRAQKVTVEENIAYDMLVVQNVPRKNEKRVFPPDPTAPWLEMFARIKNASASKRNVLNSDPRQHIVALEVQSTDGGVFEVMIDGQVFKGMKKIHISRIYTVEGAKKSKIWNASESASKPKGSPVIFPIEGFFPVED